MMNNVSLMGRLTMAPELKTTPASHSVCNFTVASNKPHKPKEGAQNADFVPIVAWDGAAEFVANHFNKGDLIAVTGRLTSSSYEVDGKRYSRLTVTASQVDFCGYRKPSNEQNTEGVEKNEKVLEEPGWDKDDDWTEPKWPEDAYLPEDPRL